MSVGAYSMRHSVPLISVYLADVFLAIVTFVLKKVESNLCGGLIPVRRANETNIEFISFLHSTAETKLGITVE